MKESVRVLDPDFDKSIKRKKEFLDDLKLVGIELKLIRKAIHYMTLPPHECHEVFSKTPRIDEIKKTNVLLYKEIISTRKALSALLNNSVLNQQEKGSIKSMKDRLESDYGFDLADRKRLKDNFRAKTDVTSIEDYKDDNEYPDDCFGCQIDKRLKTWRQCEAKLIYILYNYIEKFRDKSSYVMRPDNSVREIEYKQKDIFELIAEILNLRWLNKYNYEKIRLLHRNYKTVK